jgi:Nucleotidyltransferase
MSEQDPELQAFAKFIGAIEPWLDEAVLIGGWAHRLYRLHPLGRKLGYLPLTTLDGDVAIPPKLKAHETTVRQRLLDAGFKEEFVGDDRPPATHYHYGKGGSFYAEFLTPLGGSEYDRSGKRKATTEVGGISSQLLRYIEILMISPWKVELGKENGYSLSRKLKVQIANPTSFLAQKILIHEEREPRDRAKDLLYIHDTIDVFSENLGELQKIFGQEIAPRLHSRKRAKVEGAVERLFGKVADTIREAAVMAVGRNLSADRLAETSQAGLKEIFSRRML